MSDDFAAAAARMYPSHGPAPAPAASAAPPAETGQPVAEPTASAAPAGAEPATPRKPWSRWGEQSAPLTAQPDTLPAEPAPLTAADKLYDAAPASPNELSPLMPLPADAEAAGFAMTPEAGAERAEVRTALHGAGLSRSEIGQAWGYAVRSAHPGYVAPDADATEAALRREYGAEFDANMTAARKFTAEMMAKSPAIRRHLRDTGLQNDASFIRAVVAAATRRAR